MLGVVIILRVAKLFWDRQAFATRNHDGLAVKASDDDEKEAGDTLKS